VGLKLGRSSNRGSSAATRGGVLLDCLAGGHCAGSVLTQPNRRRNAHFRKHGGAHFGNRCRESLVHCQAAIGSGRGLAGLSPGALSIQAPLLATYPKSWLPEIPKALFTRALAFVLNVVVADFEPVSAKCDQDLVSDRDPGFGVAKT
jgi:hypothetical protein